MVKLDTFGLALHTRHIGPVVSVLDGERVTLTRAEKLFFEVIGFSTEPQGGEDMSPPLVWLTVGKEYEVDVMATVQLVPLDDGSARRG